MATRRITVRIPGRCATAPDERFVMWKQSCDGSRTRTDPVYRLTLTQCRDTDRFPPGLWLDKRTGKGFVYTHVLMDEYL